MLIHQKGMIPLVVIVALLVASLIGGFIGFQLGDGTFFSFGVGVGLVLVAAKLLSPFASEIKEFFRDVSKFFHDIFR